MKILKIIILSNSIFLFLLSSSPICHAGIPSIIIYKINMINFFIMKNLVKVKFANIINIINRKEIIPELLQGECNAKEIFKFCSLFIKKSKTYERPSSKL